MALMRCTCVYRASTSGERSDGAALIVVAARDPWCPSMRLHERTASPRTPDATAR